MSVRHIGLAFSLIALCGVASAEQRSWTFNTEESTVAFVLGATMHKVHGTLQMSSGWVVFDPATGEASGEIVVDAKSADTENKKRDRDMHAKVLESELFPSIVLRPRRIEGALPERGEGPLTVVGVIEMHGAEHELSIPLQVVLDGDSFSATAEFEVPYVEWGLKNPSKLLLKVAKHVTVTVEAHGTLSE